MVCSSRNPITSVGKVGLTPLSTIQILLSCETEFKRDFPSTILGSLSTVGDVLKVLENTPASVTPPSLFPDIDKNNLPPNLSIQMAIAPKKVQKRVPFQNYSKPEYAEFSQQETERC